MTIEKMTERDCRRFQSLEDRRAEGDLLTEEEELFRRRHMEECPRCRALVSIEDLLAYDGLGDGPQEVLDDVSLHRRIADILDAADQEPIAAMQDESEGLADAGPGRSKGVRWLGFGVVGVGLAAALSFAVVWFGSRSSRQPASLPGGKVLYRGGEVSWSGGVNRVEAGAVLKVGKGRAGLALPCKAEVAVLADTELELTNMGRKACRVRLKRGGLFVVVAHRKDQVRFVVETSRGVVSVKGTAFSVSVAKGGLAVDVLRGLVTVDDRDKGVQLVPAGQAYDSTSGIHALAAGRLQGLAKLDSGLHLFSTSARRGGLAVDSDPPVAKIWVDGVLLGQTPLRARLPEGLHSLQLLWPTGAVSRVTVNVPADGTVEKTVVSPPLKTTKSASGGREPVGRPDGAQESTTRNSARPAAARIPRKAVGPTADALMAQARQMRVEGKWRRAASLYRRVVRTGTGKRAGATAKVLLGWVLLRHLGKPAEALKWFDAYLAQGGGLSQEAAYGRILALRKLGRTGRERRAIEAFLARYPRAIQASSLRRRLKGLQGGGRKGDVKP